MTPAPMRLRRDAEGLYDLDNHHPVSLDRIADHVRDGGRFTVVSHDTGADCTRRVLADLLHHIAAAPVTSVLPDSLGSIGGLAAGLGALAARRDER